MLHWGEVLRLGRLLGDMEKNPRQCPIFFLAGVVSPPFEGGATSDPTPFSRSISSESVEIASFLPLMARRSLVLSSLRHVIRSSFLASCKSLVKVTACDLEFLIEIALRCYRINFSRHRITSVPYVGTFGLLLLRAGVPRARLARKYYSATSAVPMSSENFPVRETRFLLLACLLSLLVCTVWMRKQVFHGAAHPPG